MPLVLAKILLTPALIVAILLVRRRWGAAASGWLLGLPLISGPVSVLLFVEHGQRFALDAAQGTLTGLIASATFCATYAIVSERRTWLVALAVSFAAFFATAWLLEPVQLDWVRSGLLVAGALTLLARSVGPHVAASAPSPPRKREITAQIVVSCALVALITTFAGELGPHLAGMLAPLPVISAVMATASMRRSEESCAHDMLRGAVVSSWGGAAFFAVAGSLMGPAGPVAAYAVATAAAVAGGSAGIRLQGTTRHPGLTTQTR